jgi:hypothetical protein
MARKPRKIAGAKAAVGKAAISALIPGAGMFGGGRTAQQPGPPPFVPPKGKKGRKGR